MDEQYRGIEGYPAYRVTSGGQVQSCWGGHGRNRFLSDRWSTLKPYKTRGYARVKLSRDGRLDAFRVHRLVLEAFVGTAPRPGWVACHNDGDPENNRLENLRWDTPKANSEDARRHGTLYCGEAVRHRKLGDAEVLEIRRLRAEGVTVSKLAARFGVSRSNIRSIVEGRTWRHLLPLYAGQRIDSETLNDRGAA
jgi:hypothetical protein